MAYQNTSAVDGRRAVGRGIVSSSTPNQPADAPSGNHTDGVSVADLIAKMGGVTGNGRRTTCHRTSKNNRLNFISALDPNSHDIVDPYAQFGDENFLIVGVDSRFGENPDMGAGDTKDAGGARSDTVMLVNIPASRQRVVAVSFPRDLAIKPTLCDAWDPQTRQVRAGV